MKTKNDIAIKVQGLAKSFGDVQAVAAVDFEVNSGELFGVLGPNDAGKTSGAILAAFCVGLFMISLHNIRWRWIA